ncbi:hypothetical protein DICPUDRAFT_152311 [Dictyostelium purpureum]|uniref:Uncharacterized protein n=1 Tax=Dictyostelium purpureum TaxID=5786 RepID=F0ZL13_DICPU|nr:uncharacterized protein DICPUDRAFT_152311 [Dictyostelium purpureum]EGC35361.1 hypothetical protein DICPUDRAFT_152311 [Dictyostelium purpureum]|eukprot:XP_003288099.1 hypothetical protein DICPUDRAFT_152311 [Dictyostelium purpureum]
MDMEEYQTSKSDIKEIHESSSISGNKTTTTTNNLSSNNNPPIKKEYEHESSSEFNNYSYDTSNLGAGRRSVESDEFREYLLKELSMLK